MQHDYKTFVLRFISSGNAFILKDLPGFGIFWDRFGRLAN
jgi:hypothetical protein